MIYTLTLNPAVDYCLRLPHLARDGVTRAESASVRFGGKGINVSLVLSELGVESVAMGLIAGFTGDALEAHLRSLGISTDFVRLPDGMTRINVKVAGTREENEINAPGPSISAASMAELEAKLDALGAGDTLVMAGSLPPGLPPSTYARLSAPLAERGVRVVADVSGEAFKAMLTRPPYMVKPNLAELEELVGGRSLRTTADAPDFAAIEEVVAFLRGCGVRVVLVSLGKYGAYLSDENGQCHTLTVPARDAVEAAAYAGEVLSDYERRKQRIRAIRDRTTDTVGAGDSMVAGFLCGIDRGWEPSEALRLAVAAGSATAYSDGLATRPMIEQVLGLTETT